MQAGLSAGISAGLGPALGSAGGGSTFAPTDVSGLSFWLDAADSETVLNSVSPDVVATDGQTVRRWMDKSTNLLHMNQTAGLNQPLCQTEEVNGRNTVQFDGVNDLLRGQLPDISTATIFQVHRSSKAGTQCWLNGQDAARYVLISADGVTTGTITANVGTPVYRVNGVETAFANRDAVHDSIATGSAVMLTATSVDFTAWSKLADDFFLGYEVSVNLGIGGDLCELLIYDGSLSSENISAIESYLATKWGVTLA